MSTRPDLDRSISAWLIADAPASAPRHLLERSRERIRLTHQRRWWLPARRIADMDINPKLAIAAAALVVAVVVGINLLPASGGVGGPAATPTPSPTLSPSPTPPPKLPALLDPGQPIEPGIRRSLANDGSVQLSLVLPTDGWSYDRTWFKHHYFADDAVEMYFWVDSISAPEIFTDPCAHTGRRQFENSTAGVAAALTSLDGIEVVDPPSDITIGGRPATTVSVSVPADVGCVNTQYWLWYGPPDLGHPTEYPTWLGSKARFATVDLGGGRRLAMKAETRQRDPGPAVEEAIQEIWDSLRFE